MRSTRRALAVPALASAIALVCAGPSWGHSPEGGAEERLTSIEPQALAQAGAEARAAIVTPPPTSQGNCRPGSNPEPGMQGRVSAEAVASGKADNGFTCNTTLIGRQGKSGGFKVERFVDRAGRECAYYDTTLLFPSNIQHLSETPTGAAVLDMSNPAKPVRTTTLATPAMSSPHESLLLNERRGLLAAVLANPIAGPGAIDIYDLNADCRYPVLQSSLPFGVIGHESGFAPDGNTFYTTSIFTGQVTAVDVSNPQVPVPLWSGFYRSHGLTISEDGNRAYVAANSGLIVLDVSEIQSRKLNPQVREVSRLTWDTLTVPQVAIPVTIDGRPFLVEVDEFSGTEANPGIPTSHGIRVGAARIIDIADEKAPKVVSDIRLAVHQPENRPQLAGDPGAGSPVQGYAGHYCAVPRRKEPGIVACSFIASGLRVFDIRDPYEPKEIAYFVAPIGPSSTGGPPSNFAMSAPAFAPGRGEIWYADGNTGFYAVKVADGVWPFGGRAGSGARGCVARRSPIGPSNVGRVRLGLTRPRMLRRVRPDPVSRSAYAYRWCVKRSSGRVTAVFSRRLARGRARLVISTAPRHRLRSVSRGSGVGRLLRRFPGARRLSSGIYRAGPRSRRVFGTRRGKVRFVGVADTRLLRNPRELRRYLRRAGV